jgi:hypothetical protein
MKRVFGLALLALALTGCGYDGHYRYPCQNPDNFQNEECKLPLCKVTGTCTIDLLGFDPETGEAITIETEQDVQE